MTRPHEELGAKVRRLQAAVAEVHGCTTVDGVTVRTDASGRLTGLDVSAHAYTMGPNGLSELIMRVYNEMADDVGARTTAILAELHDDPAVAHIVDATTDTVSTPQPVQQRSFNNPPQQRVVPESTPKPIAAGHQPTAASTGWLTDQVARSRGARLQAEAELARRQAAEWEEEEQNLTTPAERDPSHINRPTGTQNRG